MFQGSCTEQSSASEYAEDSAYPASDDSNNAWQDKDVSHKIAVRSRPPIPAR